MAWANKVKGAPYIWQIELRPFCVPITFWKYKVELVIIVDDLKKVKPVRKNWYGGVVLYAEYTTVCVLKYSQFKLIKKIGLKNYIV